MKETCPFDLVIGLDRSDAKADLCSVDNRTGQRRTQSLDVSPESLQEWAEELRKACPAGKIAICVEQPAPNLLIFLEGFDFITLFAINPVTLQKFREAFVTSRAKDDKVDAGFLAELVLSHHEKLTRWHAEDSQTRLLGQLVVHRRAVVDERTRLSNRFRALLKQYFPQALQLAGEDLWRPLGTAFLLRWPTLQEVKKARPETLRKFYYAQGSRSQQLVEKRLELVSGAVALCDQEGLLETYSCRIKLIARELRLVDQAIKTYDKRIAEVFHQHPDREIFRNLPGAGPTFAPRLLVSLGSRRERYPSNQSLQCFTGIAPVTKQSGKKCHVHRRYLCPKFVRQSFHEFAKESILHSRWAAAYYKQQRERGGSHNTAVRALAYKWQRIIWRCWQDRVAYREQIYEAALRSRKSPLTAALDGIVVGKFPITTNENKS